MKRLLLSLVLSLIFMGTSYGANHYILAGGSGDGSAWNNAWDDLPGSFTRGDTYYVGDGNYGGHTFDTAVSGSTNIYIKKATEGDHGTETGWSSTYGDGVAHFYGTWVFGSNYWEVDGQVGSGKSGHGLHVQFQGNGDGKRSIQFTDAASYIDFDHVDVEGQGIRTEYREDCIYSTTQTQYITWQYCYIHDTCRNLFTLSPAHHWTVEYCYIANNDSVTVHEQAVQLGLSACTYMTFRYNVFENTSGTGTITMLGTNDFGHHDIAVYGNLFFDSAAGYSTSNGVFMARSDLDVYNCWFYNNTVVDKQGQPGLIFKGPNTYNTYAYNNIWYTNTAPTFSNVTHNYNAFKEADAHGEGNAQISLPSGIFNDYSSDDFTLSYETDDGTPLSSPYNEDFEGDVRGYTGNWDRGYDEYGAGPYYVASAASGNNDGTDWTNAWTYFPSSSQYSRGAEIYVAAGNYGAPVLDKATSGTRYVYIQKATAGDHGTDTGWSAGYGTGIANFTGTWQISTDYWDIDGITGSDKTGHGFYSTTATCSSTSRLIYITDGADHIKIKHMELEHCGIDQDQNQDCIYTLSTSDGGTHDLCMSYCWLHNATRNHAVLGNISDSTFEYCYFSEVSHATPPPTYSLSMDIWDASNTTIRYNIFENIEGTSILSLIGSDQTYIYGNLFFRSGATTYTCTNGAFVNTGVDGNTDTLIYNNTLVDLSGKAGIDWGGTDTGAITRNNLWVNCDDVTFSGGDHITTNNIIDGDPALFNGYWSDDFTLTAGTSPGYTLSSPYDEDMYGATRGADGNWDIGYDESTEGGPPTTTTIGSTSSTSSTSSPSTSTTTSVSTTSTTVPETGNELTVNVDGLVVNDLYYVVVDPDPTTDIPDTCYYDTDSGQCVYDDYETKDYDNTTQAEDMEHDNGIQTGDWWNLYSNGDMYTDITFPETDMYTFDIRAKSQPALGVHAYMTLKIDDVDKYSTYVTSTTGAIYSVDVEVEAGTHEVAINFSNDYYDPPNDRNLFVDYVTITTDMVVNLAVGSGTGKQFDAWTGDVPGGDVGNNPLDLALSGVMEITATYKVFDKVTGLAVDDTSGNTVSLSWDTQSDADYYRIEYDQDGSSPFTYSHENIMDTSVDIDVPLLGTWYFQVKAFIEVVGASNAETLFADSSVNTTVYRYEPTTSSSSSSTTTTAVGSTTVPTTSTTTSIEVVEFGTSVIDHYVSGRNAGFTWLRWFSDAEGTARVVIRGIDGQMHRIVIRPHPYSVPSNNYDMTIKTEPGWDILNGDGANLDNDTITKYIPTVSVPINGPLTLEVFNAGDIGAGWIYLWWN